MPTEPTQPGCSAGPMMARGNNSYAAMVVAPGGPERLRVEEELLAQAGALTVQDRAAWNQGPPEAAFVVVRDGGGRAVFGFSLKVSGARVPGHRLLRAARVGGLAPAAAVTAGIRAAVRFAHGYPRVLRFNLECFTQGEEPALAVSEECRARGFRPVSDMRSYLETILIDLGPTEAELMAGFHATARRFIRAVEKHPVAVRPVAAAKFASRMDALLTETMARTGGQPPLGVRWPELIRLAEGQPEAVRLIGLFDERPEAPEPLLAFALGLNHGQHVEYGIAATDRNTDLKLPQGYALAWDLICWGKRRGARWFDFGGVTRGAHGDGDSLGGISDFKRYFSRNVVQVGSEWVLESRSFAAVSTRILSGFYRRLRS